MPAYEQNATAHSLPFMLTQSIGPQYLLRRCCMQEVSQLHVATRVTRLRNYTLPNKDNKICNEKADWKGHQEKFRHLDWPGRGMCGIQKEGVGNETEYCTQTGPNICIIIHHVDSTQKNLLDATFPTRFLNYYFELFYWSTRF